MAACKQKTAACQVASRSADLISAMHDGTRTMKQAGPAKVYHRRQPEVGGLGAPFGHMALVDVVPEPSLF